MSSRTGGSLAFTTDKYLYTSGYKWLFFKFVCFLLKLTTINMEHYKTTCSICKMAKVRIQVKEGVYIDETNSKWRSKWCPPCSAIYYKNYRLNNNLNKGGYGSAVCPSCEGLFEKKGSIHKYCSVGCKR